MAAKTLKRNIFQRILGIPATKAILGSDRWKLENGNVTIDLSAVNDLAAPGTAVKIEDKSLKSRLLIVHGEDGKYHAFKNECAHAKRRLDPLPGEEHVQCCSVGKATYDYTGKVVSGNVDHGITAYDVKEDGGKLTVFLS